MSATPPTVRMPVKLIVLVAGLAVLAVLDFVLAGDAKLPWVTGAIKLLLVAGILKGSEGARNIMVGLAGVALVVGGFRMVLVLARGGLAFVGPVAVGLMGLGVVWLAFLLWCLMGRDVRDWMFSRTAIGQLDKQQDDEAGR